MARRDLRKQALQGNKTFGIAADLEGLDSLLADLEGDVDAAIRPVAQAASQVLYERVKVNVRALGRVTGNLERAIYQAYSPEKSVDGQRAEYHVSWNHRVAPHGHLVEWGYLQRYRYYRDNQGRVRPMVRPGMDGKKPPGRRASQAQKDAYYVTLQTPIQVPGKAFIRSAESSLAAAQKAAEAELWRRLFEKGAYHGA
ncbi:HK97 gp10 family phage protein [Delftia sp. PS-11]|uniref:HK97 gp10 family phage protein n=1 Tax=Delftia sp. PS-11 TaxID=2767222 RepID=UPI0024561733|nr:HK97 gp10 family phage protein [Delftia sp. PS-11]KAJ8743688.1 HK97 gp10 family phage protein [Delftia sp. PS-11]